MAITPNDREMIYAISNPVIVNPKNRIYIIIYKKFIYDKFYSHKKSVYEQYTADIRFWKLDLVQKFWMPVRNGLRIGIEEFPALLVSCQKLFEFFIDLAENDIKKKK